MRNILFAACLAVCLFASCSSDDVADSGSSSSVQTVEHIDSDYTYELPVIFHVLYNDQSDPDQFIPYQRLADIIGYVNNIYQGGVYGESENLHVKFVLATEDEDGNELSTPGVEYVKYSGEYPIDPYTFMNDNSGVNVKYIWDPNNYINIMMYNFRQDNSNEIVLGISHMPYTVRGSHQLDGLETVSQSHISKQNLRFAYCSSINSEFANSYTDSNGDTRYYQSDRYENESHQPTYLISEDIVVTVAHELGHYLGLFHTFTENRGNSTSVEPVDSCGDTDYCTDTYSYNRYDYIEYLSSLSAENLRSARLLLRRNACDGTQYNSDNIMDYSLTLGFKVTPEQKRRVRNVLYYSPLIPGPKMSSETSSRASVDEKPLNLKITTIK